MRVTRPSYRHVGIGRQLDSPPVSAYRVNPQHEAANYFLYGQWFDHGLKDITLGRPEKVVSTSPIWNTFQMNTEGSPAIGALGDKRCALIGSSGGAEDALALPDMSGNWQFYERIWFGDTPIRNFSLSISYFLRETPSQYQGIYSSIGNADGNNAFQAYYDSGMKVAAGSWSSHVIATTTPKILHWNHQVVTVAEDRTTRVFENGRLWGSGTAQSISYSPGNGDDWKWGYCFLGSDSIYGGIGHWAIYQEELPHGLALSLSEDPYQILVPVENRRRSLKAPAAAPVGAVINQFMGGNLGADLFDGTLQ